MSTNMEDNMGTRERLLEAAGEVFSERGYEKATVREIVKRAKTNLNAVNYHFRDKEQLYVAVLLDAHQKSTQHMPGVGESIDHLRPEQRLRRRKLIFCSWPPIASRCSRYFLGKLLMLPFFGQTGRY